MEFRPSRQAVPKGLALLVVILGVILPGSTAQVTNLTVRVLLSIGLGPRESYCCSILRTSKIDCVCDELKSLEDTNVLVKVCNLSKVKDKCIAREKAKKAANDREKAISKLAPCDKYVERLRAKEFDKINPDDVRACSQPTKTSSSSRKKH
ncbi:hypothetical protein ACP70R_005673 [Stipagrostis hirtigluma subsp. patula]